MRSCFSLAFFPLNTDDKNSKDGFIVTKINASKINRLKYPKILFFFFFEIQKVHGKIQSVVNLLPFQNIFAAKKLL